MLFNKKGVWGFGEMMSLILVVLVVLILLGIIPIFGKNTVNSVVCSSKNGVCRDRCLDGELPWYADVNRTCEKKSLTCCLPKPGAGQGTVASSECAKLKAGDKCSTASNEFYYCNEQLQCVSKCEYCGLHPSETMCKVGGKEFFNSNFICGCTLDECKGKIADKKCTTQVTGFCYSGAYCCEK